MASVEPSSITMSSRSPSVWASTLAIASGDPGGPVADGHEHGHRGRGHYRSDGLAARLDGEHAAKCRTHGQRPDASSSRKRRSGSAGSGAASTGSRSRSSADVLEAADPAQRRAARRESGNRGSPSSARRTRSRARGRSERYFRKRRAARRTLWWGSRRKRRPPGRTTRPRAAKTRAGRASGGGSGSRRRYRPSRPARPRAAPPPCTPSDLDVGHALPLGSAPCSTPAGRPPARARSRCVGAAGDQGGEVAAARPQLERAAEAALRARSPAMSGRAGYSCCSASA